jgi:hypothetical protein
MDDVCISSLLIGLFEPFFKQMPKNCLLGLTVQIVSICNLKSQFGGG